METIVSLFKGLLGRTVKGLDFKKGDYIKTESYIMAKTNHGRQIELDYSKILKQVGGTRITDKKLSSIKGMNVNDFRK